MLKAEALVAGVPLPHMDNTIRIRVKRRFYYKRELQSVGNELDCPYGMALEVIHIGKAERVVAPAPKAPEPEPLPAPQAPAKKAKE